MQYAIMTFGSLIVAAGLIIATTPQTLLSTLRKHADNSMLFAFAVIIRLLLGGLLIVYAPQSAFPLTLQFLGWIAVAAAVAILVAGKARLRQLIEWVISLAAPFARPAGIVVILFGAFLVYAVR